MRSRKLHTQLLKGRSNHAIPLADESFKHRLPTPFFLSQTFVFLRDRPLGETSTDIMIGHLLLTTFWEFIW